MVTTDSSTVTASFTSGGSVAHEPDQGRLPAAWPPSRAWPSTAWRQRLHLHLSAGAHLGGLVEHHHVHRGGHPAGHHHRALAAPTPAAPPLAPSPSSTSRTPAATWSTNSSTVTARSTRGGGSIAEPDHGRLPAARPPSRAWPSTAWRAPPTPSPSAVTHVGGVEHHHVHRGGHPAGHHHRALEHRRQWRRPRHPARGQGRGLGRQRGQPQHRHGQRDDPSGAGGSIAAGGTSGTFSGGTATFSGLALNGVNGTVYTLTFSGDSFTSVASSNITMSTGAATQLVITTEPSTHRRQRRRPRHPARGQRRGLRRQRGHLNTGTAERDDPLGRRRLHRRGRHLGHLLRRHGHLLGPGPQRRERQRLHPHLQR